MENEILDNILDNQDEKLTETNNLLENVLDNQDENSKKLQKKTDDGSKQISEAIKELKPVMSALGLVNSLTSALQGDKGSDGKRGNQGDKGNQGEKGSQGEKGDKGSQGEKGTDGSNGIDGLDGKDGENGLDGLDGKNGLDGLDGKDGKSIDEREIVKGLKKKLSYKDLKDKPTLYSGMGVDGKDGIGFDWLGAYDSATTYKINDSISYLGSSYVCILKSTGNLPTDTSYFNIMAESGTGGSGGSGDVVGPASATDNNIATFDTTTGKLIQDSGSKVSDFAPALGSDDNYVTDSEKTDITDNTTHRGLTNNPHGLTLEQARSASNVMTGGIVFNPTVNTTIMDISGSNLDLIWMLGHDTDAYGYYWKYEGTGNGDANYLYLYAEGGTGSDFFHLRYHQINHEIDVNSDIIMLDSHTVDGRDVSVDGTKLDGIEDNATADQIISDATISTTDITTNNVSTSKHGFAPKGNGSSTSYLNGNGSYSTPAGGGNVSTSGTPVDNDFAKFVNGTDIEGRSSSEVRTDLGLVVGTDIQAHSSVLDNTTASFLTTDESKLDGIETGAEVNNISDVNATDLTDSGDSTLHYHSSDRARANHTGTQSASTISDFDTEVANNSTVTTNTGKVSYPGSASATELNILDGATLTTTELNYVDGVTSAIQTQLNSKMDDVIDDTSPELGGEMDCGAHSIGFTQQSATGDGTTTIDWKLGNKFKFTFGAMNETFTFTAPSNPCNVVLVMVQDSTGSRTVTFPSTVKWAGGTAPTLTTTANAIDIISLYFDGTNYYGVGSLNFS